MGPDESVRIIDVALVLELDLGPASSSTSASCMDSSHQSSA